MGHRERHSSLKGMEKQNCERTGRKMQGTEENNSVKSREGGPQHLSCSFPCGWKVHLRRMAGSSNEQSREWGKGTELVETCKQAGEAQSLLLSSKAESNYEHDYWNQISVFFLVPSKFWRWWLCCEDVDAHAMMALGRQGDACLLLLFLPLVLVAEMRSCAGSFSYTAAFT